MMDLEGEFICKEFSILISKGHNVVFDLNDIDIDIILLTDPRKSSESSILMKRLLLLQNINSNAVVITELMNVMKENTWFK